MSRVLIVLVVLPVLAAFVALARPLPTRWRIGLLGGLGTFASCIWSLVIDLALFFCMDSGEPTAKCTEPGSARVEVPSLVILVGFPVIMLAATLYSVRVRRYWPVPVAGALALVGTPLLASWLIPI
jgi:hypothetical protein